MNLDNACCAGLAAFLPQKLFKALSDPARISILAAIAESRGEMTVSQVAQRFPQDISVISRHLAILREAGVLAGEKRGKQVFYRVRIMEMAGFLRKLADALVACCPPQALCADGHGTREWEASEAPKYF